MRANGSKDRCKLAIAPVDRCIDAMADRWHALAAHAWITVGGLGSNPEGGINTPSRSGV